MDKGVVLLLGGRSEIGLEIALQLAPERTVVLATRRSDQLDEEVTALRNAGAGSVHTVEFDADALAHHQGFLGTVENEFGPVGVAIVAFGVLGDQARAEDDAGHATAVVHTDYVAQVSIVTLLAKSMRARRSGQIVVFSSVAGVRVRKANYVYGSAKAGLDGFASGLSDSLHGSGVDLLLVRPGFVIGRMTAGMAPAPFSTRPAHVAESVVSALAGRKREVWIPGILRPLYVVARFVPRFVWRRLPR